MATSVSIQISSAYKFFMTGAFYPMFSHGWIFTDGGFRKFAILFEKNIYQKSQHAYYQNGGT